MTNFGHPLVRPDKSKEIILKPGDVGFFPEMYEETRKAIEEIEANLRQARALAHTVWLD